MIIKNYEKAIAKDVTLNDLKEVFNEFAEVDFKGKRLTVYDLMPNALEDSMDAQLIMDATEQIALLAEFKEEVEDAETIEEFDRAVNNAKEDGYDFHGFIDGNGWGFAWLMEEQTNSTNFAAIRELFIKFFGKEHLAMFDYQMKDALGIDDENEGEEIDDIMDW